MTSSHAGRRRSRGAAADLPLRRLHRYRLPSGEEVVADLLYRSAAPRGSVPIGWFLDAPVGWFKVRADGVIISLTAARPRVMPFDVGALVDLGRQRRCRGGCAWGYEARCPEGKDVLRPG